MDYQQEERQFFGGSMVKMPMGDFVKEHRHLINVLQHGSRKVRRAEANSQARELRSRLGVKGSGKDGKKSRDLKKERAERRERMSKPLDFEVPRERPASTSGTNTTQKTHRSRILALANRDRPATTSGKNTTQADHRSRILELANRARREEPNMKEWHSTYMRSIKQYKAVINDKSNTAKEKEAARSEMVKLHDANKDYIEYVKELNPHILKSD